jgi:hypothetical protein
MAIATRGTASNYLQRAPSPSGLADVIDLILDKGLVIDAYVRIAVIGIELVTIDARIVIASVDTYLRFAEACNRLDLEAGPHKPAGLTDLTEKLTQSGDGQLSESGSRGKAKGALSGAAETMSDAFNQARGEGRERQGERAPRRREE